MWLFASSDFNRSPRSVKFDPKMFKFKSSVDLDVKLLSMTESELVATLKLLALGLTCVVVVPNDGEFPTTGGVALVAKVTRVSREFTSGRGNVGTPCKRSMWEWLVVGVSSVTCSL